jgi:hypothetical protein
MVLPFEFGTSSPYRWGVSDISVDASPAQGQGSDSPCVGLNVGESIPPEQTAIVAAVSASVSRGPTPLQSCEGSRIFPRHPPGKKIPSDFSHDS